MPICRLLPCLRLARVRKLEGFTDVIILKLVADAAFFVGFAGGLGFHLSGRRGASLRLCSVFHRGHLPVRLLSASSHVAKSSSLMGIKPRGANAAVAGGESAEAFGSSVFFSPEIDLGQPAPALPG
jgi:hypothetical protein